MFEIARQLEQTAGRFNPAVLIWPGLAAVLVGLFVWLGGLESKRTLVAIVGGVSGGICGFFISGRNIVPAMISAGIAMVIAIILEKIFIAILAGVLAAILGFAVLARPDIENAGAAPPISRDKTQNREEVFSIGQSAEIAKGYIADFVTEIKRILSQMPAYNYATIAAIAMVFIVAGFFQQHLTSAFCCAALGTMLIFAGMISLLLYKGAAPISRICQNPLFYLGVFGVMTAFGMAEQLLLCQRIKGMLTRKKEKNKPEKISESWRNR
ncbi:MAG: hypothetical protein ABSG99_08100 [Sedimentisphaerales bacterium]